MNPDPLTIEGDDAEPWPPGPSEPSLRPVFVVAFWMVVLFLLGILVGVTIVR